MEILAAPETLRIVLKCFADKLWESIEVQKGENFKEIYYNAVIDLLRLEKEDILKNKDEEKKEEPVLEKNETQKVKVFKKPKIPIPFYGHVIESWCYGIKKNHGLYTQCPKIKSKGEIYCKICAKQSMNNASGKPNCGNIRDRLACWSSDLT